MIESKEGLLVNRVKDALHSRVSRMIEDGKMTLPKERELAMHYGVSVRTVRSALNELKQKRILHSIPGKGTFIVPESKRKQLTLVLANNISHPFTAAATEIILDVLREQNMPATISVVGNEQVNWDSLGFSPDDIGGIIILAPAINEKELANLRRSNVPIVVLGDFPDEFKHSLKCNQVRPDAYSSSFTATRYLLEQGHKQILLACWGGETSWGKDLKRGYCDALKEAGVKFNPDNFIVPPRVEFTETNEHYINELGSIQKDIDRILSGEDAPTAVIHNSSMQVQAEEMMHSYFHDKFAADSIVVINHVELLKTYYFNGEHILAVAMPYRSLINMAINLMKDEKNSAEPLSLTVNGFRIWKRVKGNWQIA